MWQFLGCLGVGALGVVPGALLGGTTEGLSALVWWCSWYRGGTGFRASRFFNFFAHQIDLCRLSVSLWLLAAGRWPLAAGCWLLAVLLAAHLPTATFIH